MPQKNRKEHQNRQPETLIPKKGEELRPVELAPDQLEKVTGGANFWFFDDERRKPRGIIPSPDHSNGG